jgi:uncharacterized membrane protein YphA (DoxX/SURF4 family)
MSSSMVRRGALARLAAAVMFLVAAIVNLISPYQRGVFDSFSDYLYQLLVTVAFALLAVAIAGLHALQSGRYGRGEISRRRRSSAELRQGGYEVWTPY